LGASHYELIVDLDGKVECSNEILRKIIKKLLQLSKFLNILQPVSTC